MVEHDGCIGCKYERQDEHLEPCLHCDGTKDGDYYKHMTNGDKIRSMSDEELAEFIEQVSTDIMDTISYGAKNYEEIWEHKEGVLKYLQSKAE